MENPKAKGLFELTRNCCVCNTESRRRKVNDRGPDKVRFIGVYCYIHRRDGKKRQFKPCPKVNICEPCLISLLAEPQRARGIKGTIFSQRLVEAIGIRYNAFLDDRVA
jgi:hypothetical protein